MALNHAGHDSLLQPSSLISAPTTMSDASSFAWPASLEKYLLPDETFAQAYADLTDIERSWIKKNIAQLYTLAPANGQECSTISASWHAGLRTLDHYHPRDWGILVLDGASTSPSRTVASLVPAATSGIPNLLCVFLGQFEPAPHLLVSLELCGQDQACAVGRKSFRRTLNTLDQTTAKGLILDPDGVLQNMRLSLFSNISLWRPAPMRRLGIWSETPDQWDWQTLAWNHPDVDVEVWGAGPEHFCSSCKPVQGDWTAFCNQDYRFTGVPADLLKELPRSRASLVLTPGQEGCWRWPELPQELFWFRQSIMQSSEMQSPQRSNRA